MSVKDFIRILISTIREDAFGNLIGLIAIAFFILTVAMRTF